MANLPTSVEAPAAPGDPDHRLPLRIPAGVGPVAQIALPGSALAVPCGPVDPGHLFSALAPPSPCQIGRFEKRRRTGGLGRPSGAIAPPSPDRGGRLEKERAAGPYSPLASDAAHKYLDIQSLVPNQGLDSADPDSYHRCCFHSLGRGGGGCEGTSPSGNGTRHAVAFPARGGSGSRRVSSGAEAGTAGPVPQRVIKGSQPTQCHTLGLARGSGPFEPRPGGTPPCPPSPPPVPSPAPGNFEPGSHLGLPRASDPLGWGRIWSPWRKEIQGIGCSHQALTQN